MTNAASLPTSSVISFDRMTSTRRAPRSNAASREIARLARELNTVTAPSAVARIDEITSECSPPDEDDYRYQPNKVQS